MQEPFSVNNHKISARQIHRTLTLELLGISTLLLPSLLAGKCGMDGIFALAAGGAGAFGLLALWKRLFREQGLRECLRGIPALPGFLIRFFYGVGFTGIAAYTLYLMTGLIEQQLLGKQKEIVILVTLSLVAFFGLLRGMECRVRVYEVLYVFLLLPLLVMLGIACVGADVTAWTLVADTSAGAFLQSCYVSFLFFAGVSLYTCFRSACGKPEAAYRGTRRALAMVMGCNLAVYLILFRVFGRELLAHRQWPVIDLMAVVKLPGNFLERQDALMIGIWFFCLFAFLDSMLYYAVDFLFCGKLLKMFRKKKCSVQGNEQKPSEKRRRSGDTTEKNRASGTVSEKNRLVMTGILVCMVAVIAHLLLGQEEAAKKMFGGYVYGVLPVMLFLPLLCAVMRKPFRNETFWLDF